MLKFFRDQKDGWLVKGILLLTALSFMSLFGVQGMMDMMQKNKPVITMKGKDISTQDFLNAFEQQVASINAMTGGRYSKNDAFNAGMATSVLNNLASKTLMGAVVDKLGLTVSDGDVREYVKSLPMFAGYNGRFSQTMFNEYLRKSGKTEAEFINDVFLQLKADQLLSAARLITVVPRKLAEFSYEIQGEKRSIDLFRITAGDIKISGNPSKDELQKLYEEMAEDLIAPEFRKITVIALDLEQVADRIKISEEELKENYEESRARFTIEEIRNVDQMLFETEDEARKAYEAVTKKGQDFMKVAKAQARQTEDLTNLGNVSPSTVNAELVEPLFSAKKGGIVAPVQTDFGWQIFRVNSIAPKKEISFAEARKDLEKQLKDSMAYSAMIALATNIDDRLGAGESLESIAKSENIPLKSHPFADPSGMDEKGKDAGIRKSLLSMAFIAEQGRVSPMIEDGNSFFAFRIDAVRDPTLKTLEQAKPELMRVFTERRQRQEAQMLRDKIEAEINKGTKNSVIAKMPGVSFEQVKDLTRRTSPLPAPATYALFAKNVGGIVASSTDSGYLVAKITGVAVADPRKDAKGVMEVRRRLAEELAGEKADSLLVNYSETFNVQVHEEAVKQAFSYLTKDRPPEEDD